MLTENISKNWRWTRQSRSTKPTKWSRKRRKNMNLTNFAMAGPDDPKRTEPNDWWRLESPNQNPHLSRRSRRPQNPGPRNEPRKNKGTQPRSRGNLGPLLALLLRWLLPSLSWAHFQASPPLLGLLRLMRTNVPPATPSRLVGFGLCISTEY